MDDNQLYSAIQQNDKGAFSILFDQYYERLCNFCLRLSVPKEVVEEIVSDIFLNLWDQRNTKNIQNLKPYLYVSAKNSAINWLRSKASLEIRQNKTLFPISTYEHAHEKAMILREELSFVEQIIAKMPEKRRTIFLLNRIEGLKYKEIAEVLKISPHTVQNQMVLAIKFLHQHRPNKRFS